MRQTRVPHKVTRSTKLQSPKSSPELALRSTDFRAPETLIFPALSSGTVQGQEFGFQPEESGGLWTDAGTLDESFDFAIGKHLFIALLLASY